MVLEFLEEEFHKNPNQWFTIEEVKLALKRKHKSTGSVWRQVNRLVAYSEIENKLIMLKNCRFGYQRVVRAKKV